MSMRRGRNSYLITSETAELRCQVGNLLLRPVLMYFWSYKLQISVVGRPMRPLLRHHSRKRPLANSQMVVNGKPGECT